MDRGAWQATVHGVAVRHDLVTKHTHTHTHTHTHFLNLGLEDHKNSATNQMFSLAPMEDQFLRFSYINLCLRRNIYF